MNIIAEAEIQEGRSSSAKHLVMGREVGPAFKLRIVQLDGETGFYLIRYEPNGNELADTLHDTFKDALDQAYFEYHVTFDEWRRF